MIGVLAKPGQLDVVEEFFQLFKTPWEYYRPEGVYSAVIATCADVSNVSARVLLVYGAEAKSVDAQEGIIRGGRAQSACLNLGEAQVPIYGDTCTFTAFANGRSCVVAGTEVLGVRTAGSNSTMIRMGYDLFEEVRHLLVNAQPFEYANIPTLDAHIDMLRTWIVEEGNALVEIPSVPSGYSFTACLTHDIDFIGIRHHKLDHTMLGFLYRSTVGAARNLFRGKTNLRRALKIWRAAATLPLVYLGWAEDFWEPFEWYLAAEKDLPATYFLIPFKRRAGDKVTGAHASRRASAYDVSDLTIQAETLQKHGCELGVHGLDAWHSVEHGRAELERVRSVSKAPETGVRMHWLLQDATTYQVLEDAGFAYDSTAGYNETVGYRNGTTQVFRPLGARTLLEIPIHIQDGALFLHNRLNLTDAQARQRCRPLFDNARKYGGVLTVLWHDRSHGPERFWGGFYLELIERLKSLGVWFGSAGQVVQWFGQRRAVRFEPVETTNGVRVRLTCAGEDVRPAFTIRVHAPGGGESARTGAAFSDLRWDGKRPEEIDLPLKFENEAAVARPSHS